MTVNGKIKIIDNFSSGNVGIYEFLTGEDVLLEKAATIKKFEYSHLGSELKKQTYIARKQYQGLDKVYEFDKKGDDETINKDDKKPTLKKYTKSDSNHSFYKYRGIKKFDKLSLKSKYSFLADFFNDLDKFNRLKPQIEKATEKKTNVFNTASEL